MPNVNRCATCASVPTCFHLGRLERPSVEPLVAATCPCYHGRRASSGPATAGPSTARVRHHLTR
eukprot:11829901-Alexandrium_andersonii.AAC.1